MPETEQSAVIQQLLKPDSAALPSSAAATGSLTEQITSNPLFTAVRNASSFGSIER